MRLHLMILASVERDMGVLSRGGLGPQGRETLADHQRNSLVAFCVTGAAWKAYKELKNGANQHPAPENAPNPKTQRGC